MTDTRTDRYRHYDAFYRRRNAPGSDRGSRQQRDYARRFGPLLAEHPNCRALDVGCADGRLCAFLKMAGCAEVVGVDLNERLIEEARENVAAEFVVADAAEYLQSCQPFDIIFLLNVLEHLERDRIVAFLGAVHRALTADGFAVVRTPNMSHVMAAGHLADDLTHCTGLTEQSLEQAARAAGFARVEMLDQWHMQTTRGKVKALLNWAQHKYLWWLRGGTRPRVFYRNLYAQLIK